MKASYQGPRQTTNSRSMKEILHVRLSLPRVGQVHTYAF